MRDTRVVVLGQMRHAVRFGMIDHRAELNDTERNAVETDPFLRIENRPFGAAFDTDGDKQEKRREEDQTEGGDKNVERPLDTYLRIAHVLLCDTDERRPVDMPDTRSSGEHIIHAGDHTDLARERVETGDEFVQPAVTIIGRHINDHFVLLAGN